MTELVSALRLWGDDCKRISTYKFTKNAGPQLRGGHLSISEIGCYGLTYFLSPNVTSPSVAIKSCLKWKVAAGRVVPDKRGKCMVDGSLY